MSAAFKLMEAVQILGRTPFVLHEWLFELSPIWTHADYGPDTFTVFDIVGHLLHCERNDWIPRARRILEHGPTVPFEPLDRYAQFEASRGKTISQLLQEFARARTESLQALEFIKASPDALACKGTHPAFGPVTLEQLLATWVVHDLNHLAQIAKAMATQYANAVGPWREYLSILKTPATPMDPSGAERARAARAT